MMIALIAFSLLMSLICVTKKHANKFELMTNTVFGVIFTVLAIYTWKGGSL